METAFDDILKALVIYRQTLRTSVPAVYLQASIKSLHTLANKLRAVSVPAHCDVFVDKHLGSIYRIYDSLVGDFAKLHVDKSTINKRFRGICDTIMKSLGITQPTKRFAGVPTYFLLRLLGGITYFATDTDLERPIYHRTQSCGTSKSTLHAKFAHQPSDTKAESLRKKTALQKCYIERMVFNRLYNHVLHRQEVRHLQELKLVENLWQDYNPGSSIDVDVGYNDDTGEPNLVSISYAHGKTLLFDHEIYVTGDQVKCERSEYKQSPKHSPFLIAKYAKTQTFQREQPWKLRARSV